MWRFYAVSGVPSRWSLTYPLGAALCLGMTLNSMRRLVGRTTTWRGTTYSVSRQWTLWRMMAHDLHHGGELSTMLGTQGLKNFELGDLGGHITEPTVADES